jgi:hypothetical protein
MVATTGQAYAYTGDDPVNGKDPSGDMPVASPGSDMWWDDPNLPAVLQQTTNRALQNAINDEYKGSPEIKGQVLGDGSSTDMMLDAATSPVNPWNGKLTDLRKYPKLLQQINRVNTILKGSKGPLTEEDKAAGNWLLEKYQNAKADVIELSSGNLTEEVNGAISAQEAVASDAAAAGDMSQTDTIVGVIAAEEDE